MRVLFNTYPVAFDCPGGGEVQLLECKRALEQCGVRVRLFDTWQPRLDEVDIVHYFSVQGGSMNFCDHIKRRGLPLAISPILWLTAENKPLFPLAEIRDLLHRADRILPNSATEAQQLSKFFEVELDKFTVVPNGVSQSFFEPADPELFRSRYKIDGAFLLCVANIEPRKNQRLLIEAAGRLDLPVVLIGRTRDAEYFESCRAAARSPMHYLGAMEHGNPLLASAYRACEAFVLPSLLETPGLAALEAAAQGARLVITSVGSTREYFGEHASYADPLDVASICRAVTNELARPATSNLRDHVLANFTWAHAADALLGAYRITTASPVHCV